MADVDYSDYSLKELYEAQRNVNRESYPRNAELIDHWILIREGKLPEGTPPPPPKPVESPPESTRSVEPYRPLPEPEPLPPAKKLPVSKVVADALALLWTRKVDLLRALTLPYVLVLLLEYCNVLVFSEVGFGGALALSALSSLVYASFAVTCHRLVLLGNDSVPLLGVLVPGMRVLNFWLCTILLSVTLSILSVIVALPVGMIFDQPWIPLLLVAIPALYIFSRLSLLFPAIAIDDDRIVTRAWLFSRENGLRMMALIVIPVLPGYFGHYLFADSESMLIGSLIQLGGFLFAVIGIILVYLSYQELRDETILGEPETRPIEEVGADA